MADTKFSSRLERHKSQNPSVDWDLRHDNFVRRMLATLERVSLLFETPITKLIRDPRYNPLYHTGTITVFLLGVILITGVYLTMFYQFGFTASYETIVRLEKNFFNALMRAVHRYASGAALITGLLHGWRTFFQDRFRGPRWLAWVTGVVMTAFFWAIGVSGYWLLWDERAQVINQSLIRLIENSDWGQVFLVRFLTTSQAGSGWIFLLLVLTVHLGLSVLVGLFLWWHLKRLSRPKWLPPRFWMAVSALLLIMASALVPVGLLPSINPTQLPGPVPIDPLFLAYLPAALQWNPSLFWGSVLLLITLASSMPWILARKALKPVEVDLALCDGCVLCSRDCPYNAITMVPRSDGARPKFQAEINQSLCISCGICIGSCPENALTLGMPIDPLWTQTTQSAESANLVFTCERHLLQGTLEKDPNLKVVPLTCVGMLHPDLIGAAIDAGADSVRVVGCPPEDCANREGNLWLQQRLDRDRLPRLRIGYTQAPITSRWAAPGDSQSDYSFATAYSINWSQLKWRNFIPAITLVAIVLVFQVGNNNIAYTAYHQDQALLEVSLNHHSGYPLNEVEVSQPTLDIDMPTRLIIEVDDQVRLDQEYALRGRELVRVSTAFEQIPLKMGGHQIRILMMDRPEQDQPFILFEQQITFDSRQSISLNFSDASLGSDPAAGKKLYYETSLGTNAGCRICHSLEPGQTLVGPSFAGLADRAAGRVPGISAEEYIRQSILEPDAYIVEGFPSGQMIPNLDEVLTEEQIDNLIAFLMTIKEE
jgi:ferredoxin/coenzyme F420-reducing hydrogenase delta subunit